MKMGVHMLHWEEGERHNWGRNWEEDSQTTKSS